VQVDSKSNATRIAHEWHVSNKTATYVLIRPLLWSSSSVQPSEASSSQRYACGQPGSWCGVSCPLSRTFYLNLPACQDRVRTCQFPLGLE